MTKRTETPEPALAGTRSIEVERTVSAPPEEVWDTLTTSEGLRNWFPLDARVEPGEGGSVWLSWGPGCEGEAAIHVWERPRRFGWTERHGNDEHGRPVEIAVDFHIEGREGSTVVRVVQSGFGASEQWDAMIDAITDGWTYFLFNLAFYFRVHRGKDRTMVWRRVATTVPRNQVWERLREAGLVGDPAPDGAVDVRLDRPREAEVVSRRDGFHFAAVVPELGDSVLFVELEGANVGLWLSTYGLASERVAELQRALDERIGVAQGT